MDLVAGEAREDFGLTRIGCRVVEGDMNTGIVAETADEAVMAVGLLVHGSILRRSTESANKSTIGTYDM